MSTDEKIVRVLEELQAGQKDLQVDVKGLHAKVDTLDAKVGTLDRKVDTLELRVEAVHAYQKQAHTEIMDCLYESNEITGRSQKALEKRIDRIEKHLGLSPLK